MAHVKNSGEKAKIDLLIYSGTGTERGHGHVLAQAKIDGLF